MYRRLRSLSQILVLPYVIFFLTAIFTFAHKLGKKFDNSHSTQPQTDEKIFLSTRFQAKPKCAEAQQQSQPM